MKPVPHVLVAAALLLSLAPVVAHARKTYKVPTDQPTANLRLLNPRPDGMYMRGMMVDLTQCRYGPWLPWIGGGRALEQERVGMPESEPPRQGLAEQRIQAGVPTAIAVFVIPNGVYWRQHGWNPPAVPNAMVVPVAPSCPAPLFVPEAGANYEVVFDARLDACEPRVLRLDVAADGSVQRVDITGPMVTFKPGFVKVKGDCSALATLAPAATPPPKP